MCIYIYIYISMLSKMYIHIYTHLYVCLFIYCFLFVYVQFVYIHMYTNYTHTYSIYIHIYLYIHYTRAVLQSASHCMQDCIDGQLPKGFTRDEYAAFEQQANRMQMQMQSHADNCMIVYLGAQGTCYLLGNSPYQPDIGSLSYPNSVWLVSAVIK